MKRQLMPGLVFVAGVLALMAIRGSGLATQLETLEPASPAQVSVSESSSARTESFSCPPAPADLLIVDSEESFPELAESTDIETSEIVVIEHVSP